MSDLPEGWEWTTLRQISLSIKNGIFVSRPTSEPDGVPILRINAVRPLELRLNDLRYSRLSMRQVDRMAANLQPGDLLFTRYSGSREFVGVGAVVPAGVKELTYPDKLIRVRLDLSTVDAKFVAAAFAAPEVRARVEQRLRTTAGQVGISGSDLGGIELPLPSLAEQRRIVDAIDQQLMCVEQGVMAVHAARRRARMLVKAVVADVVAAQRSSAWRWIRVGEAGRVDLGRQRHPDWHHGPNMKPYLRVANVFEDRIDLSDVMKMHFSPAEFERFRLHPGDILLNEGQSPEYLGRPAMYTGEPDEIAFTNSLLRFRAGPDVLPEWALLVFRHHMHSGRFMREVRITTNIAHLSAGRFKAVEFPVPPLDEQARVVASVRDRLDAAARLADAVELARSRADQLRRSVLTEAFAGRLVPQDPADEPASVLLARIRAERPPASRRRIDRR